MLFSNTDCEIRQDCVPTRGDSLVSCSPVHTADAQMSRFDLQQYAPDGLEHFSRLETTSEVRDHARRSQLLVRGAGLCMSICSLRHAGMGIGAFQVIGGPIAPVPWVISCVSPGLNRPSR